MQPKFEIAQRLREFGEKNFGSMVEFAAALGMKPQTLNSYLSGKASPGNKIQERLRKLGCDLTWLMLGQTQEELNKASESFFLRKARELRPNDYALLDVLKEEGIESAEMLRAFFDKEEIAKDVAAIMAARYKARLRIKSKKGRKR